MYTHNQAKKKPMPLKAGLGLASAETHQGNPSISILANPHLGIRFCLLALEQGLQVSTKEESSRSFIAARGAYEMVHG